MWARWIVPQDDVDMTLTPSRCHSVKSARTLTSCTYRHSDSKRSGVLDIADKIALSTMATVKLDTHFTVDRTAFRMHNPYSFAIGLGYDGGDLAPWGVSTRSSSCRRTGDLSVRYGRSQTNAARAAFVLWTACFYLFWEVLIARSSQDAGGRGRLNRVEIAAGLPSVWLCRLGAAGVQMK